MFHKLNEEQKAYIADTIERACAGTPLQPNAKFAGSYLTSVVVSIMENWDVICDNLSGRESQSKDLDKRITPVIVSAIALYNRQHPAATVLLTDLKWDHVLKCFVFERHGMLHGVELDGYIHT